MDKNDLELLNACGDLAVTFTNCILSDRQQYRDQQFSLYQSQIDLIAQKQQYKHERKMKKLEIKELKVKYKAYKEYCELEKQKNEIRANLAEQKIQVLLEIARYINDFYMQNLELLRQDYLEAKSHTEDIDIPTSKLIKYQAERDNLAKIIESTQKNYNDIMKRWTDSFDKLGLENPLQIENFANM